MNWDSPLDPIVITVAEVAAGLRPVLVVTHDDGHGGWQLLDGAAAPGRRPVVIPKVEALRIDPTIAEVADLPSGWRARRTAVGAPWLREPNPDSESG